MVRSLVWSIAVVVCSFPHVALEREGQVRLHTHGALQNGATPAEITETLIQLMVYCGFPAGWQAMVAARQVIAEHTEQ
jgi:4-carboxymuconolactone decarboxylase